MAAAGHFEEARSGGGVSPFWMEGLAVSAVRADGKGPGVPGGH